MTVVMYVLGAILLVAALFLIVAVLMQNSKSHKLSGTIAGGAETFFGKSKGADVNKKLNTATIIVAIIFVVLVAVMYIIQPEIDYSAIGTDESVIVDESGNVIIGGEDAIEIVEDSAEATEDTVAESVEDTAVESVEDTAEAEAVSDEAVSE